MKIGPESFHVAGRLARSSGAETFPKSYYLIGCQAFWDLASIDPVRVANRDARTALRWAANVTRSHLHISPFLGNLEWIGVLMIRNPLSWRLNLTQRRTLGCSSQAKPHGKTWQDSSRCFCGVIIRCFSVSPLRMRNALWDVP
jgi:hypothetical protein